MTNLYIAREPECGCITYAHVDRPEYADSIAGELENMGDREVERITLADGEAVPIRRCPHWAFREGRYRTGVPIEAAAASTTEGRG